MNFFKRKWIDFTDYVKNNKKNILINYLIFTGVFVVLILIDLLTKKYLFDKNKIDEVIYQNALFGIKSVMNYGLTFTGNLKISVGLVTFFNVVILLITSVSILFFRSYWFAISLSFIFSGSLGNTVDRLALGYVRDIIFFPWFNRGTFNFADADVIVGSIGLVLTMLIHILVKRNR